MSTGGGQSRAGGWLERELQDDGRRPHKLALALALRSLFRLLKTESTDQSGDRPPTQTEVVKRLGVGNTTSLSRFAGLDSRVPSPAFVDGLYEAACLDATASGREVGITPEELQTLRVNAEAEGRGRCEGCAELGGRIDSLTQQLNTPCPACAAYEQEQKENAARTAALKDETAALRGEVTAMRAAIQEMQTVEAGLQARLAMARASRTPLPVPPRRRDRQRSEKERAVARQLAAQAAELDGTGKEDYALALLRRGTAELLSPSETALVIVELRQQECDHLTDNLIHVYGRDQGDRDVLAVALELHEEGAVDDAGAILRAALG